MTRPLVEFKVSVPDTEENRSCTTCYSLLGALKGVIKHRLGWEGVTVTEIALGPGEEKRDGQSTS